MKIFKTGIYFLVLALVSPTWAQGSDEDLRKQVEELGKTVKSLQEQVNKQQEVIQKQGEVLQDNGFRKAPGEKTDFTETPEWKAMKEDVGTALTASRQKRPGMFNPSMSMAIDTVSSYSRNQGVDFVPRDVEFELHSNVDQYAYAYAVFNAASALSINDSAAPGGLNDPTRVGPFRRSNATAGVEEAAIETTSLPAGLKLRAGQFFADFTRLDKVHQHDRPFSDGPRSLDTLIGGEAQARGFELQWLTPMDHYLRVTGGMVDGIGAQAPSSIGLTLPDGTTKSAFNNSTYRGFNDLTWYTRAATIFDLAPGVNLNVGADYATNYRQEQRQMASADYKLEWKPDAQKWDLFTWSTEAIWTKTEGNLPLDSFTPSGNTFRSVAQASSYGGYTYVQYRLGKYFEPGFRFDLTVPENFEMRNGGTELSTFKTRFYTYSPYLTLNLSEFDRLRFQLNYIDVQNDPSRGGGGVRGIRSDIQFLLQWTVLLGAHEHGFSP